MGVSNEKRAELITTLSHMGFDATVGGPSIIEQIVDRIIEEGWQWHPKSATPGEEIELMDRIISGLPVDLKMVSNQIEETQGEKIIFVEPTWVRIPKFKDYEVNDHGVVRNFWTKRVLGVRGAIETVELHDSEGYPKNMSIKAVMNAAFGPDK